MQLSSSRAFAYALLGLAGLFALVAVAESAEAQEISLTVAPTSAAEGSKVVLTAKCMPGNLICPETTVTLGYTPGTPGATGSDYVAVTSITIPGKTGKGEASEASRDLEFTDDSEVEGDETFTVKIDSTNPQPPVATWVVKPSPHTITIVDTDEAGPPAPPTLVRLAATAGSPCATTGWTGPDNVGASDDAYANATAAGRSLCKELADLPPPHAVGAVEKVLLSLEQSVAGYANDEWRLDLSIGGGAPFFTEFVPGSAADAVREINVTSARAWTTADLNALRVTVTTSAPDAADGTWKADAVWVDADVNRAPVGQPASYSVAEDTYLSTKSVNGTDADDDALTFTVVAQPTKGTVTVNAATGAFNYTAKDNNTGADSFSYTVSDGKLTSPPATVSITITAVNDPPVLAGPTAQSFSEDTVRAFHPSGGNALAVGDVDAGSGQLRVTVEVPAGQGRIDLNASAEAALDFACSGCSLDGDNGTTFRGAVAQVNAALRGLAYTPPKNATGAPFTTLTLRVSDEGNTGSPGPASATKAVALTLTPVNDEPTLAPLSPVNLQEDAAAQTVTLAAIGPGGGSDEAGQSLKVTATSSNTALIPDPAVTYTSPSGAGSLAFEPADNATGTAVITVTVKDSGPNAAPDDNTTVRTFTVTVSAVNDAPKVTVPGPQATDEDTAILFTGAKAISVSDVDAGTGALRVNLTGPAGSRFTLAAGSGVTFSCAGCNADGDNLTVFQGTLAQANAALNGLSFLPPQDASGAYTLNVTASDLGGTGSGGALRHGRDIAVTVAAVNDAPVNTVPAAQTVQEDGTLTFSAANGNALRTSDVDAAPGTVKVTLSAVKGNLTLPSTSGLAFSTGDGTHDPVLVFTGTVSNVNLRLDGLRFLPSPNFAGAASVTLEVNDTAPGTAWRKDTDTVAVTVGSVNDLPTISDVADQAIAEDGATPALAFTVGDLETPAASLAVTGTSSNPALVPNVPANITFGGSGASRTVTVKPAKDQTGTATITLTVTDGNGGTRSDSFVLTVTAVPDTPTVSDVADQSTPEDVAKVVALTVGDGETAASALTLTATSSNTALLPNGNIAPGGSGASRTLTLTPAPNLSGTTTVTVTVQDGSGQTASDTFVLTVAAVNDAPTLNALAPLAVNEDAGAQTVALSGIGRGGGSDEAGQSLAVTATSSDTALIPHPAVTYASPNAAGSLAFTPAANGFGTATVTVRVTDSGPSGGANANAVERTFTVTVHSVNDAPTVTDVPNQSIQEDGATPALPFTVGDVETAAGSLAVSATSSNAALVPVANVAFGGSGAARTVTVTPAANQFGTATVTVRVSDGSATATDTLTVTVASVNDAPTLSVPGGLSLDEDAGPQSLPLTGIGPGGGAPEAGQALTLSASSSDTSLVPTPTVTRDGSSGTLAFTPAAGRSGTATITVTARDNGPGAAPNANTTVRSFLVTIGTVNDPPTLVVPGEVDRFEDEGVTIHLAEQATEEDTPIVFTDEGAGRFALDDPDSGDFALTMLVVAINGTAALGGLEGVTLGDASVLEEDFGIEPGTVHSFFFANGTAAALDAALDGLTFTPAPEHSGEAFLALVVSDMGHTGGEGVEGDGPALDEEFGEGDVGLAVAVVNITIAAVDDPPLARPESYVHPQGLALNVSDPADGVLANDADVEGSPLAAQLVAAPPAAAGALALNPNGTFTFTPAAAFKGTTTFTYRATDGAAPGNTATVSLTFLPDADADGRVDPMDNCPTRANADQADGDGDGKGNPCDSNLNDGPLGDADADGTNNASDNCPSKKNVGQADSDADGVGDDCDSTPTGTRASAPPPGGQSSPRTSPAPPADGDGDGRADRSDNCPASANADQADVDGDGRGDACDGDATDGPKGDSDGDGKANGVDNCPASANAGQADVDGDGKGDACDGDATDGPKGDSDGDGKANGVDNCPAAANAGQADADADGVGDACDAALPPPRQPTAVSATLQQDGTVLVAWTSGGDPTVRLHRVWRASVPVLVGEVAVVDGQAAYTFADTAFPGGHHEYFVEAVRDAGQPSVLAEAAAGKASRIGVAPCSTGPDADGDGLCNAQEVALGTDVGNADSDGDGSRDSTEALAGTDPLEASSVGEQDALAPSKDSPGLPWLALAAVALALAALARRRR